MKKIVSFLLAAMLCFTMGAGYIYAAEEASQKIVITSVEELLSFAESVNDGSMYGYAGQTVKLDADLDLSGVEWEPIGNMSDMDQFSTVFMGTFDGDGHTISNLTFESDEAVIGAGLFGVSFGTIQNLNMENCDVSVTNLTPGESQAFGIIVGYNMGGLVTNCSVKDSSVTGLNCIGAIAGGSGGSVTDCTVTDCQITVIGDNDFSDGLKQCDVAECGGLVVGGAFGGTVSGCTASGTIIAEGNEPVGLGGIAGCLEMMDKVADNMADVEIVTTQGGHAIGGLCGYAGTHSDAEKVMEWGGVEVNNYPGQIHDCSVTAKITAPGATHTGGLIGTNLYFLGEETAWHAYDCSVKAEINGAITPGALAGRAVNSTFENCTCEVSIDGVATDIEVGTTDVMYESLDQMTEEPAFAGGTGTPEDPWQVASAEQIDRIRDDLTASYVLIADIDLSGYENWEPIGAFQPLSDAPEDAEIPHPDYAFTGTFDGNGHTISNMTIASELPMAVGLFGCATGSEDGNSFIRDFNLENINVSGFYLVGGAVGLQFMNCPVSGINLIGDNSLCGAQGIGGIVGTGFDTISDCTATADITVLGTDGACAGLIAGGTTMSPIIDSKAAGGSITAEGDACWGIGALCGAPWGAQEITNCTAADTIITVSGENNRLVGGLLGFGGSYDPENPAQISGCAVENVSIIVSDSTNEVGGLIGGGKEMMEGSDIMSLFSVDECTAAGSITGGGEHIGAVVGDPACAVSIDCEGGMEIITN